jgi:hypothetical protein
MPADFLTPRVVVDSVDKPPSITGSPENGRSTPDEFLARSTANVGTAYRLNGSSDRLHMLSALALRYRGSNSIQARILADDKDASAAVSGRRLPLGLSFT